jgi:pyrroline-5-carboxylate reductase
MGQAITRGIVNAGLVSPGQMWGATRNNASAQVASDALGIRVLTKFEELLPHTRILLLCVKPAQIGAVVSHLARCGVSPETLLISIAAGVSTTRLEELLGTSNPWVRAMPNTPVQVGESMTVLCGGKHATAGHVDKVTALFGGLGQCRTVEEHHFNAVTALSGSGPAYVYLMIEAMADAGVRVGLPRKLALDLVAQTVVGAARMIQQSGRHPASLRDDVTTPAGCTIGGLLMLEDGRIRSVLARAIEEAARIAQGLGAGK